MGPWTHDLRVVLGILRSVYLRIDDARMTSILAQYAIPLMASGIIAWFIFWAGQRHAHQSATGAHTSITPPDALPSSKGPALRIELGTDQNYERIEHFENGLIRRSVHVAVVNGSGKDIADCNIKLIATTPPAMIGKAKSAYPIFFTQNFDLAASKRKYVKIVSFAEGGAPTELERDNIFVSAAVGGFFGGWTTISPLPTKNNPAILTFEAFAPTGQSSQTYLKVWVDETLGRKLCASIA